MKTGIHVAVNVAPSIQNARVRITRARGPAPAWAPTPTAKMTYAVRQPTVVTRSWATGGSTTVPTLAPLDARPTARPRRATNHFTTVVLHGTYAVDMPSAATRP